MKVPAKIIGPSTCSLPLRVFELCAAVIVSCGTSGGLLGCALAIDVA
jgi:hypothetical protein